MKKGFLIFIIGFLYFTVSGQQNDIDSLKIITLSPERESEIINDIRAKFEKINKNIYLYNSKTLDNMGHSAEGGTINTYSENDEFRKVEAIYYGETGKAEIDYYFWDNKVFFIFRKDFNYNSPIYITKSIPEEGLEAYDETKTKLSENRYYFTNNKLIRWINEEKLRVKIGSTEYFEKQKDLLEDIDFIKRKIFK